MALNSITWMHWNLIVLILKVLSKYEYSFFLFKFSVSDDVYIQSNNETHHIIDNSGEPSHITCKLDKYIDTVNFLWFVDGQEYTEQSISKFKKLDDIVGQI